MWAEINKDEAKAKPTGKEERTDAQTHRTLGRMTMKSTSRVLGNSLLRSLVRSHRSGIHLLLTARFVLPATLIHSFVRSLAHFAAQGKETSFQSTVRLRHLNVLLIDSFSLLLPPPPLPLPAFYELPTPFHFSGKTTALSMETQKTPFLTTALPHIDTA